MTQNNNVLAITYIKFISWKEGDCCFPMVEIFTVIENLTEIVPVIYQKTNTSMAEHTG